MANHGEPTAVYSGQVGSALISVIAIGRYRLPYEAFSQTIHFSRVVSHCGSHIIGSECNPIALVYIRYSNLVRTNVNQIGKSPLSNIHNIR